MVCDSARLVDLVASVYRIAFLEIYVPCATKHLPPADRVAIKGAKRNRGSSSLF
jgi:hypothetical protein